MNILFFLPELGGGGAQRTLINVANELSGKHEVTLAAASAEGPARAWVEPHVPVVDLNCGRIRWAVMPLVRLIREKRPAVLLASGVDANMVAWLAHRFSGPQRPRLVLRETNSHRARGDLGAIRRWLIGRAYRSADCVVALSNGVRDELIELYKLEPERVRTIHNPVAVEEIARRAEAARSQAPPWPKSGLTVMGCGRLTKQKGFDRLIDAVAQLNIPGMQLVILGEGELRQELHEQAERLGLSNRLFLPGFVQRPEEWLAHADVFALSSRWEGFGHVIVEAMAAGAPVVAFDCPHGPRDILCTGINGIVVAEGDVAGFAAALARVLEKAEFAANLRLAASADALRYARSTVAQKYFALFEAIVS